MVRDSVYILVIACIYSICPAQSSEEMPEHARKRIALLELEAKTLKRTNDRLAARILELDSATKIAEERDTLARQLELEKNKAHDLSVELRRVERAADELVKWRDLVERIFSRLSSEDILQIIKIVPSFLKSDELTMVSPLLRVKAASDTGPRYTDMATPSNRSDTSFLLAQARAGRVSLLADDGTFLGTLSDRYDIDSIGNKYGLYGSKYGINSISSPYSLYGSKYSPTSAYSLYATNPPKLVGPGGFIAYVTKSVAMSPRVDPDVLRALVHELP